MEILRKRDQDAAVDADGVLVTAPEFVLIGGFEIPAKPMLGGAPEHEVERGLGANGVGRRSGLSGVNPLRAGTGHKLDFPGKRPGLFEEQIGAPLGGVPAEERCDAGFEFEPVFYRGELHGGGWT